MSRTYPEFTHSTNCPRRRPPLLRLSWRREPELWCPDCGRHQVTSTSPATAGAMGNPAAVVVHSGVDPASPNGGPHPGPATPHHKEVRP